MNFNIIMIIKTIPFLILGILKIQLAFAQENFAKGLKDYYKNYFPIGVAVTPQSLKGEEGKLILQQFNSITPENVLKPGPIHPEENKFNFVPADEVVNFAQANGIKVRGHNLCWHQQTGNWFFKDE